MPRLRVVALVGYMMAMLVPMALHAQTILYKCIENGRVTYSERQGCAAPAGRADRASGKDDLPPDGVNVAAQIQAEFERETAARHAQKEAQAARAKAEQKAKADAEAGCLAELRRHPAVENSAWDGSVWQAENYLKRYLLRDPDSYESVGWTRVKRNCNGYTVSGTYRARNGFGGMNLESAVFEFDRAGNVINVTK